MRQPNELARKVMARAADHHAKLADQYEMIADIARRYAVSLREGKAEQLIDAADQLESIGAIEETKRAALKELDMLKVADPEYYEELTAEARRLQVSKLDRQGILLALLVHSAQCKDPTRCEYHDLLEKRAQELER